MRKLRSHAYYFLKFQNGDKFKDNNSHTGISSLNRGLFQGQVSNEKTFFFSALGFNGFNNSTYNYHTQQKSSMVNQRLQKQQ
jgi:hypothetical protein